MTKLIQTEMMNDESSLNIILKLSAFMAVEGAKCILSSPEPKAQDELL